MKSPSDFEFEDRMIRRTRFMSMSSNLKVQDEPAVNVRFSKTDPPKYNLSHLPKYESDLFMEKTFMFLLFLPLLFVRQGCQSSIDKLFAFEDHLAIH